MTRFGFGRSRYGPFGWRRVGRLTDLVVALGLLGLIVIAGAVLMQRLGPARTVTGASMVIDGDSLRVGGEELRLEGIDAPEYRQFCRRRDGARESEQVACGRAARAALARLLAHGELACAIGRVDRYGRGLARCTAGGVDVNAAMVRDGHALAYGDYRREEEEARSAGRGIWAYDFERPADWRRRQGR